MVMHEKKDQPFIRWGEIDEKLASLKTTEIALEMGEIIQKEENRIRFENLRNTNTVAEPTYLLRMQREQTNEWARRICQAYREICVAQGGKISAEAIRAVFQHAIVTLFAARTTSVRAGLTMVAHRTNRNVTHVHTMLEGFTREMERLKWRWSNRLEAEALECEHAERAQQNWQRRASSEGEPLGGRPATLTPGKAPVNLRSAWRRAIFQAVVACGPDTGYQQIAEWISERMPDIDLPKYCNKTNERDLGWLVRHNPDIRTQFQKDLSKMKSAFRSDMTD
jgi:hypothetical protein